MNKKMMFLVILLLFNIFSAYTQEMIFIEGGRLSLGDTSQVDNPPHTVVLSDFWMGKYEVTVEEWEEFLSESNYSFKWSDSYWGDVRDLAPDKDCPILLVTFYDAIAFCNWKSEQEGLQPCYTISPTDRASIFDVYWNIRANGYRLPTEAEWEYAARGGQLETVTVFSGSNDIEEVGIYNGNDDGYAIPVGQLKPNELGLYDMTGNVNEWCWDYYDSDYIHEGITLINPIGPVSGEKKVHRGGSFRVFEEMCSVYDRGQFLPWGIAPVGFRLVRNGDLY